MMLPKFFSQTTKINRSLETCKDWLDIKRKGVVLSYLTSGEYKGWNYLTLPQYSAATDKKIGFYFLREDDGITIRTDDLISGYSKDSHEIVSSAKFAEFIDVLCNGLGIHAVSSIHGQTLDELRFQVKTSDKEFASSLRSIVAAVNVMLQVKLQNF